MIDWETVKLSNLKIEWWKAIRKLGIHFHQINLSKLKNLAKIFSFKTDLAHTLFPFLSQRRHSDVENVLFNISSLSKFYLNYEPSLKGPDVDKEQIFYFLRWKVQRKVCFIKPIETIVTRPKGPRDTYNWPTSPTRHTTYHTNIIRTTK